MPTPIIIRRRRGARTTTTPTPPPVGPSQQATDILYSAISGTSQSISWTSGNGTSRIVVVRASYPVNAEPSGAYNANAAFGSGDQIGTGNYVVYSGTGSSVTITGLTAGVLYFIRVFEFDGSSYNTSIATGNGVSEWTRHSNFNSGAIQTNFDTLTLAEQRATNRMICWLDNRGLLTYVKSWIPLCGYSTSTKALFDWITGVSATLTNSPSYAAATGFSTNGTNNYVNTQVNPSTINGGAAMSQNDASYGFHVIANPASANMGVIGTTSSGQVSCTCTNLGVVAYKVHTAGTSSFTDATNVGKGDQMYWLIRSASNVDRMYSNGEQVRNTSATSSNVPAGRTIYIGARNNNGTADAFGQASYGGFWVVNNFTAFDYMYFQVHWEIFLMEMGVNAKTDLYYLNGTPIGFSSTRVRVGAYAGQSNMPFTARNAGPPASPLASPITNAVTFARMNFANPLTLDTLEYGVNHDYFNLGSYSGGLRLAYEMSQYMNSKHYVWLYGKGGTGLAPTVDPNGWYPDLSQKLFFDFTERLGRPGFAAITETVTEINLLWGHGEADANGQTTLQYTTNVYYWVSKFIDQLESYGLNLSTVRLRILTPQIWDQLDTGIYATRDDIIAAQVAFSVANYEAAYPADAGKVKEWGHYNNNKAIHTDGTHMIATGTLLEGYRVGLYLAMT